MQQKIYHAAMENKLNAISIIRVTNDAISGCVHNSFDSKVSYLPTAGYLNCQPEQNKEARNELEQ